MNDTATIKPAPRNLPMRVLLMLLMCIGFHITAWVLVVVALVQLISQLTAGEPNARLKAFGHSAGRYLGQIAAFVTFATEDAPCPFTDWPAPDSAG